MQIGFNPSTGQSPLRQQEQAAFGDKKDATADRIKWAIGNAGGTEAEQANPNGRFSDAGLNKAIDGLNKAIGNQDKGNNDQIKTDTAQIDFLKLLLAPPPPAAAAAGPTPPAS